MDDTCGVFVSASLGSDANEGSKKAPFKSLEAALSAANGQPVYACAEVFTEALVVAERITLYGGLDCVNDWGYVGADTKTTWTAGADTTPVWMRSEADGSALVDLRIEAADAAIDGGSSIAAIVEGGEIVLTGCEIVAGNGKAGLKGDTPNASVGPSDSDDPAIKGNKGADACGDVVQQFGGAAKENALCPAANGGPIGGSGGLGSTLNGDNGGVVPGNSQTALGGLGQPSSDPMNMWSCASGNGGGTTGINGATGAPGEGAQGAASIGALSSSGYLGVAGLAGGPGAPGQGAGGGGGAKGKPTCAGASGGGGGVGGCGGNGGLGGLAGGASIAIVSLGATFVFSDVAIQTAKGGAGGDGGDGQGGGVGGNGGNGGTGDATAPATLKACNGGAGGQGGFGGKGGGGRGGHAIGIAHTGAVPSTEGATFTLGAPGAGGLGADAAHDGEAGAQAQVQGF